jgi:SHS2 domain-containing protein
MGRFRLLEHTADMGIAASGESLEALFAAAARGVLAVVVDPRQGRVCEERRLEVRGDDREEQLVNWLNEILYLWEMGRFFPVDCRVEKVEGNGVRGVLLGEPFDPLRHEVLREIKAVTYHQLAVQWRGGRWRARIYVDL